MKLHTVLGHKGIKGAEVVDQLIFKGGGLNVPYHVLVDKRYL